MDNKVENIEWQVVPGTNILLHPIYHLADITSCNSYILRAPEGDVVIDPGGRPEQIDMILEALDSGEEQGQKPVYIMLTHCHYDHVRCLSLLTKRMTRPYYTLCHRFGVEALREEDQQRTMSFLYADTIPLTEITVPLFDEVSVISPLTPCRDEVEGNCRCFIQQLDIGGDMPLCIYHAPGHSPDSICIRLGEILFAGDLFFAHQPAVAGIPGWLRSDLLVSMNFVRNLIEAQKINVIYGGHGNALDSVLAMRLLMSAEKTLQELPDLVPLDEERAAFLKKCATLFMKELDFQLAAQGGRFQRMALELSELEEESFAHKLLEELKLDEYEAYMQDFHVFASNPDNLSMQTSIPMRGLKIVRGIGKILNKTALPPEIIVHSFFRIEILLKSYLNLVMGIDLLLFAKPVNLTGMIKTCVEELSCGSTSEEQVYDLAENPDGFALYLAQRIDAKNRSANVVFPVFDDVQPIMCCSEPEHLKAVLYDILELLMCRSDRTVYVSALSSTDVPGYLFRTEPPTTLSEHKATFYALFFNLLGGTFDVLAGDVLRIQLPGEMVGDA